MNTLQIHGGDPANYDILRAAGVRRIRPGWYTANYRGPYLDRSTVCAARYNRKGEIRA
jgi:hypothetical protein